MSLSRKWYIRSRRRVTFTPIGTPALSLKFDMLFLAFVTTAFCPVMSPISKTAESMTLMLSIASPMPLLHMTMTLEYASGASFSMMPPLGLALPGFAWRFTMLIFSTKTRPASLSTLRTLPTFPFSLPTMTRTMSFFRIWSVASAMSLSAFPLENFRSQGYDLHEFLGTEFPGHGSENPGSDRLPPGPLEAAKTLPSGIVGRVQHGLHLDHGIRSPLE